MKSTKKIIVVGGGLSGLMATIKICESGGIVDLFSYCPVKNVPTPSVHRVVLMLVWIPKVNMILFGIISMIQFMVATSLLTN